MPNWCNNSITIKGPKAKIEALEAKLAALSGPSTMEVDS